MVIIAKDLSSRKRELSKPLRRHKESLREESWTGDLERAWSKVAFVLWEACSLNAKSQNLHPICAAAHGSQVFQIFCRASSRLKLVRGGDIKDFWTIDFLMSFWTVQWPLKYREKLVKEGVWGKRHAWLPHWPHCSVMISRGILFQFSAHFWSSKHLLTAIASVLNPDHNIPPAAQRENLSKTK